ncbi:dsDNA nuclease domain-containing protein [Methanosarcina sp. Z-7115]|uniref:DsDNA nuclease domain-containing protein n=1 Tax=Methanosarcina baikalica TaxID=3073890 RepID=A0ABU2D224_9EURY|nr:dsDNA nuclease domain-containing protein [Methanosarcina sp. Z-7115]MDR7666034.1 dsDNA nuclease domain-containing protein [Methanosarcina sp. Z-7115]
MVRKNPTSPLRKGFDFQDLWILKLFMDWIRYPSKYKRINFETKPEEIEGDFYFDDIVCCDKDDNYSFYQLKHKQNPDTDYWKWDEFLKQEKGTNGKKDSLFQKWFKSYNGNSENIAFIEFITNGSPENDLKECILDNKIDIVSVKSSFPQVYEKIVSQLNDEDAIHNFFSNLNFLFGQKDLEELEMEIKEFFFNELRATGNGVNSLLNNLHKECGKQYSTSLYIEHILSWCEFDTPELLEQNFGIPDDFEFFDAHLQNKILADLATPEGGIKVFCGKPGNGKSTYLSKLNQVLVEKGVVVFRHHYYLSSKDPSQNERLVSQRVIEGIKAQFKEYPEELGCLANKNSINISLREFISQLSHYFYEKSQSFVIIIDGLDHVLRYSDSSELTSFLKEICFPQSGLWIIFGTQEISKCYLPQMVFDKCPEEQWIEIKGLNEASVKNIILKNNIKLSLSIHESQTETFCERIYELTKGNPLHLRYTLHQLKINCKNSIVTVYDCENIIPYEKDIEKYYAALWRQLSDESKTIALIISSVTFSFHEKELFELLSSIASSPVEISKDYNSISHLLTNNKGLLSIYHNSFELFVLSQREFEQQKLALMKEIKKWLEKSDYEDLKWAELKKLAYELGNPEGLLGINREWLIEAICYPRCCEGIIFQLSLATKAAFENKLFDKAFELETLMEYYVDSFRFREIPSSKIWQESFKRRNPDVSDIDLERLSWEKIFRSQNRDTNADFVSSPSKHIQLISEISAERGNFDVISEAIDKLFEMHKDLKICNKEDINAEIPQLFISTIETISLDHRHDMNKVYSYIREFSYYGWSTEFLGIYASSLLRTCQISKIKELIELDIEYAERQEILDKCVENDLELNKQRFLDLVFNSKHENLDNLCLLYLLLNGKEINYIPPLPLYGEFPYKVPMLETGRRIERSKIFSDNFILGLIYGILNEDLDIKYWIQNIQKRWPLEIISQIFTSSLEISKSIVEKQNLCFSCLFENISKVDSLSYPHNRDLYELQECFRIALSQILKVIYFSRCKLGFPSLFDCIGLDNVIFERKYYNENDLLQFLLSFDKPLISNEIYIKYVSNEKNRWIQEILSFSERSEYYCGLAKLAAIHKDEINQDYFLKAAAFNLLGYGYHKDMYLDRVLDSIKLCEKVGSSSIENWIQRISPAIEYINEYTDQDHTRYFPIDYAEILWTHDPKLLYKYYFFIAEKKNWFVASYIFRYILRSLNFKQDEDISLALTALDEYSLDELRSMAEENTDVKKVLETIQFSIGKIDYPKNEPSNTYLEPQAHDYSLVESDTLFEFLKSFESDWEKDNFLVDCIKFWLDEQKYDLREIYQILIEYVNERGLKNVSYNLLDVLFPLAYEFDNVKAFEYVCLAQAKSFGWSSYFTDKTKAGERYRFIKEYYSERYMEFYSESIKNSLNILDRKGDFFVPIPRSIEFFYIFEEYEFMEKITDVSVKFVDFLMGDLEFPPVKWADTRDIDKIDLLLQRLEYPNDFVKKGARLGLDKLKKNPLKNEIILQRIESNKE